MDDELRYAISEWVKYADYESLYYALTNAYMAGFLDSEKCNGWNPYKEVVRTFLRHFPTSDMLN